MPKTYTVKEVADILGFSTNSIYTFLKEKRLRGVRIGKGRFRIPEEELSRVLHLSKKQRPAETPSPGVITVQPDIPAAQDELLVLEESRTKTPRFGELLPPNIFDLFIGLASVIAGVALFLFNVTYGDPALAKSALIFPVVRIVLIACGAGVIVSSLYFQGKGWHTVFHATLALLGMVNAFGLMRGGDVEGAMLYGLIAVVIAAQHAVHLTGVTSILVYASLIAVMYPFVFLFFPRDTHVQTILVSVGWSSLNAGLAGLAVAVVLVAGMWAGYARSRTVFLFATVGVALCDVLIGIWYAHMQYWSRAFFLIVTGYFTGLVPHWFPIRQSVPRRYKYLLHAVFGSIGGAFVIAAFVVYLLQQNIWNSRERELISKLHIAQSRIENVITSAKGSLFVSSNNPEFVGVVAKKDVGKISTYAKIIYESNPNIRRLVFLDENGNGIALYPYGTFDDPNYAYREYFQQAKATGQPYISDVFQARGDQAGRYVVVVSVPLRDLEGTFVGVTVASLDLDRLGILLDQVATSERGERFVVVDSKGVILLHPNPALIGTTAPATDPVLLGLQGKEGVADGMLIERMPGMIAYAAAPQLKWGVSLRVPSRNVFELESFAIWAVFGVVGFVLTMSIGLFSIIQQRMRNGDGGG